MEVSEQQLHVSRTIGTLTQVDISSSGDGCWYLRMIRVLPNDRDELCRAQIAHKFGGDNHGLVAYAADTIVGLRNILFGANHENSGPKHR
jgi:hypothetical protein